MADGARLISAVVTILVGTLVVHERADSGSVRVIPPTASVSERPHVLDNAVADVIVRLRGGVCSGTPLTGTPYVVTAAHCVLDADGYVTGRTVVRDGISYPLMRFWSTRAITTTRLLAWMSPSSSCLERCPDRPPDWARSCPPQESSRSQVCNRSQEAES